MKVLQKLIDSGQIPNALSCIRIIMTVIPVYLILAHPDDPTSRWWAMGWFAVIAITDKLDGYLARSWNQITRFGQIIDPLADKALVISLLVALCWTNILAAPLGWIFLGLNLLREAGVAGIRFWHRKNEVQLVIPANDDGKRKMFWQTVGIGFALMPISVWWWEVVIWMPLGLSLVYAWLSGKAYMRAR